MLNLVVVQIEGKGAFRVPASMAVDVETNREDGAAVYVVDCNGNTWAPALGEWILWERSAQYL